MPLTGTRQAYHVYEAYHRGMQNHEGISYARISDNDGAGAGVGVADQHSKNRKRAKEDGISIVAELTDDDTSAYKDVERDGYEKLLGLIRDKAVKYVLVRHADRLHRRNDQAEAFLRLAREHGIVVVTSGGQRYHLDTAEGRKAFRSTAVDGEFESDLKGERVAESRERRALAGEYSGGSRRPFGWGVATGVMRRVRDKKTGESRDVEVIDYTKHHQAEAAEIRRWRDELLAGVDQAAVIRDIPMPTVTGNPKWNSRSFWQVLLSPRTSGHSVYKGEIAKRDAWAAILSDDEREALRSIHTDPTRKTTPGNKPRWQGSLYYRCGACADGTTMTVRYTSRGTAVYRCKAKGHCSRAAVPLDEYVEQFCIARLARPDVADLIAERPDVDTAGLRDRVKVLEELKLADADDYADGVIERPQLARITAKRNAELAEINEALKAAAAASPLADFDGVDSIDEAAALWDSLSLGRHREILRLLMSVTLYPVGRGARGFDPDTVQIEPKAA